MEHFVSLDHLPEGFRIPRELGDRIRFDAESHRLIYQGFMSKADFDRLCQHTNDWPFRRKLDDLFRLCSDENAGKPKGWRKFLGGITHLWMA